MTTTPRVRSPHALLGLLAVLALALLTAVVPASSAWADGSTPVNVQITGGYNNTQNLGSLSGTISKVGTTVSYSLTVCRQSSYTPPRGTVGGVFYGADYSSSCPTFSGSFSQSGPIVTLTFSGNTFYPGNTFTEYTKTKTYYLG